LNSSPSQDGLATEKSLPRWKNLERLFQDFRFLYAFLIKNWLPLLLATLASGGLGFWAGKTKPSLYQTLAIIRVSGPVSQVSPFLMERPEAKKKANTRFNYLLLTIESPEVLQAAIQDLSLSYRQLFGRDPKKSYQNLTPGDLAELAAHELIRVREIKGASTIRLMVRAGDSTLSRTLSEKIIEHAGEVLRKRVQIEAIGQIAALEARLQSSDDPAVSMAIRSALYEEHERVHLVGYGALDVVIPAQTPEKRVTPIRKLIMAVSLTLGFSICLLILLILDPGARKRFLVVRPDVADILVPERASWIEDALCVLLIFLLFYNVAFLVLPASLPSTRLAIVVLFVLYVRKWGVDPILGVLHRHFAVFLALGLVFGHAMAAYLMGGGDTTPASRLAEVVYFALLGPFLMMAYAGRGWLRFHLHVMLAVSAQAVMHLFSFTSAGFRNWVSTVLDQRGNFELTYNLMPPGFSSGAGASFSVAQAIGLLSALILLRNARALGPALLYTAATLVILVSAGIAGRTGMLMTLVFLGLFAMKSGAVVRISITVVIALVVTLFVFFIDEFKFLVSLMGEDLDWQLNSILKRSFEIFQTKGTSVNSLSELAEMWIPPLNLETWFGAGIVRTPFGARHDSGYVQLYYALGFPMTIVFYLTIFWFVMRLWAALPVMPGREAWIFPWLIAIMFILDIKEPFITHQITFYTILAMLAYTVPDPSAKKNLQNGAARAPSRSISVGSEERTP
jgi:hypothetical protein